MNTAEKYIYTVYSSGSFSKAAEKLFVSQPALSKAIKNHEERIGYEIFNRKTTPFTLTKKGEVYIEYLEELMALENKLDFSISTIDNSMTKTLTIGGYNSTSHIVIPVVCREFSRRFPDVDIQINCGEGGLSGKMISYLDKGTIDIFVSTNFYSPKFKSEVLWREKYMILIRKDYPGVEKLIKYSLSYDEVLSGICPQEKEISDRKLFNDIRIFAPGKNKEIWKSFSEFLKGTDYQPFHLFNFCRMDLHYKMMLEGIGGIILPQSVIIDKGYDADKLCCFSVPLPNIERDAMLVYKDDENTSPYVKEFLAIAREIYGGSIKA